MPTYEINFSAQVQRRNRSWSQNLFAFLDHLSHKEVFLCQQRCQTNTVASCIKTAPCNVFQQPNLSTFAPKNCLNLFLL